MPPTTAPDDPLAEWHDNQPCERNEDARALANMTPEADELELKGATNS